MPETYSESKKEDRTKKNFLANPSDKTMAKFITLKGGRTNNLKNINVQIPLKKFTVITGVSGSGKSSLAFETLYAEGQRRYIESLSTYTRQFLEKMPKPDIDSLENIPPAIALEQKNHILNSRATVATMTEIYDYLRLLFAKIGKTFCLSCGKEVSCSTPQTVSQFISTLPSNSRFYVLSILNLQQSQKNWAAVRKSFLASGFGRVLVQTSASENEILELAELEKFSSKIKGLYLVIDRMSLPENPKKDPRLQDALDQAFQHGLGEMAIAVVPSKKELPWKYTYFSDKFRCDACKIDYRVPEPQHFSFNSPLGACPGCSGFGFNLELDENLIVPDPRRTLRDGAIDPFTKPAYQGWHEDLLRFCERHKINTGRRYEDLTAEQKKLIWQTGDKKFPGIKACFEELKAWKYKIHVRVFIRRYQSQKLCDQCKGTRLRQETLAVKIGKGTQQKHIAEILDFPIENARTYFDELKLSANEKKIADDALKQIQGRLRFLDEVGVSYLTLSRLGKTLSGGECQRINLATQLGHKLCSTLYVLDEPSIGLHPSDTDKLIKLLHDLRDHGNTLVVVEHDLNVIRSSDHIIELGPQAGYKGGDLVCEGPYQKVLSDKGCLTAKYLSSVFSIPFRKEVRPVSDKVLRITGVTENNLQDVSVEFPLNRLIAVTGVSGSGKTTLIHRTLYNALHRIFHRENIEVGKFHRLYGIEYIKDVVLLDQKPIGKSARSNPATYLKIWDDVRKIYSNQSLSIRRGYTPQYFSFNVDGGRCPVCKGEGEVTIDMHFMADLKLPCEECQGKRFKKAILEVEFKKKNIYELMRTTVEEAIDLFREYPQIGSKLQLLKKVGLGYLELGQSSTTLSGGESQRLKIASVLLEKSDSNVLYIFDEPTTGLHIDDVKRLIDVLQDLVNHRNTVLVIEHNLELISQADWVVDLGPDGGRHGGQIVATGTPLELAKEAQTKTGKYLSKLL